MHHMPCGAPVKEQVNPLGDAVKIDPEGPDVKYMTPGGQLMQEADLKPPVLQEKGARMAFANQPQGSKRSSSPPIKNEDSSIPKRRRCEVDSDQSGVALDTYNSDLSLKIHENRLSACPCSGGCFAYMWHGVRATFGFTRGRVCFEVKLEQNLPIPEMEIAERHPHVLWAGWSLNECGFTLGEEPFSWGYGGTGKASNNLKFKDYGCQFKAGDVVGAFLDLDMEPAVMSFTVNGNHQGIAYELGKSELIGRPIFPHILTKNVRFSVNFGDSLQPMASVLQDYTFVGKVPLAVRVRGSIGPASKEDCEALMMIGLPASGKTTWVQKYISENRHMKYNVLGSSYLLDKMKVDGLARKRNYSGRWDELIIECMEGLTKQLNVSSFKTRNYIIDHPNLYQAARKRHMKVYEGFRRRAIVICPNDEDLKARTAKQEKEEGKDVPDGAVYEMKANFSLPDASEPFDSIEYIELCEKKARPLVLKYNEIGQAKLWSIFGDGLRSKKYRKRLAGSFIPAAASEFIRDDASKSGKGLEGFTRGGRGSSSFDRGGGRGQVGGPYHFSRGGGIDGFGRGSDSFSRGGGFDCRSRGDGVYSNLNYFTKRGRGGFDNYGKQIGFNHYITHSSANHDVSEEVLYGDGPYCFNRGVGGGIAGFGRGRGFSNFSRGQVSDRFGIEEAPEDNNRPITTDRGRDRYNRGIVPDIFSRVSGADTCGRGRCPETYGRDSAPDCYGHGGEGGSDAYGRGDSDSYGRGGGVDSCSRSGGSDSYGRGGRSDSYGQGDGFNSDDRGGGSDSYGRGSGSDSYNRFGGFDSYSRGGGSDSYSRGFRSDSYGRCVGSNSYGRGGGSDSYGRGGGPDTHGRRGLDSLTGGTTRFARDENAVGTSLKFKPNDLNPLGYPYNRDCHGSDSYGLGGSGVGSNSYGRGGGPDTHGRKGLDTYNLALPRISGGYWRKCSGGATRCGRDGDAAGTSLEFEPNGFNPIGHPYNRVSRSIGFCQDRSAGLGDANGRGSSSFSRGGNGNHNRAGGYGNAADVDKYT